jgi:cytosine/adenosine deaminase-related metal-dependent hydrolase
MHLAESRDETAFLRESAGPFADLWRRRGIPLPSPASSSVGYLNRFGVLGPDTLVIHAVQTTELDRRTLREQGCAVALCPRSNLRHGHGDPPVAAYLSEGIRAGLGTDSLASVTSLDLFAEARAARAISGCSAADIIRLLTLGGAEALGLDGEIGSLEMGKWADLGLVEIDQSGEPAETAADKILAMGPGSVSGTWVAGRQVYTRKEA